MQILMPQLGETVAEGTIAVWHKQVGDAIKTDEILADVETDKVATEIPAPMDGVIAEILVAEGETVEVGAILAVIQGEDDEAVVEPAQEQKTNIQDAPVAKTEASTTETATKVAAKTNGNGAPLSPAVRRLLAEHNLAPSMLSGSGRNGRIKRSDVLDFLELQATGKAPTHEVKPAKKAPVEESFIPFNRLRRVTAEHMVKSKATSPHVLQAVEVDFHRVAQARAIHASSWKSKNGFSLTYLPFIARAVCLAIKEFPRVNASIENDGLKIHPNINLAIAVDLDHDGLVAPVIKAAEDYTIAGLAKQIDLLAKKARDGKINNDDLAGGTYTISNSGSFGTLITAPIINQPQVAILSTDGIKKKPVVIETSGGDSIAIRPVGILAQSFDHRAIDGAYSAAFLKRIQEIIETTNWDSEV